MGLLNNHLTLQRRSSYGEKHSAPLSLCLTSPVLFTKPSFLSFWSNCGLKASQSLPSNSLPVTWATLKTEANKPQLALCSTNRNQFWKWRRLNDSPPSSQKAPSTGKASSKGHQNHLIGESHQNETTWCTSQFCHELAMVTQDELHVLSAGLLWVRDTQCLFPTNSSQSMSSSRARCYCRVSSILSSLPNHLKGKTYEVSWSHPQGHTVQESWICI